MIKRIGNHEQYFLYLEIVTSQNILKAKYMIHCYVFWIIETTINNLDIWPHLPILYSKSTNVTLNFRILKRSRNSAPPQKGNHHFSQCSNYIKYFSASPNTKGIRNSPLLQTTPRLLCSRCRLHTYIIVKHHIKLQNRCYL